VRHLAAVASALGEPPTTGNPTFGQATIKSIQGSFEQRWGDGANDYQAFLGREPFALKQCHPARTGRGAWQSSITTFINEWRANDMDTVPRLGFLSTLLMNNETATLGLTGAYDAQYQWLADQIKTRIFDFKVGTVHPITGKVIRGIDLCGLDWMHEMNIGLSPWNVIGGGGRADGTPANIAALARRMVDVMRARQPTFNTPTQRPLMIFNPTIASTDTNADKVIDSYPGDNYVDVIACDVYAGGISLAVGPWDSPAQHQASVNRILTGWRLSLNGWFRPFADAVASNFAVARCNSTAHLGQAFNHGGRLVAKPMGFIEYGCIAEDKDPAGGDGVIDGGTGDNDLFIVTMADWMQAELQKPLAGYQTTLGQRIAFANYFDINELTDRTSHRLSPETNPDKYAYNFVEAKQAFLNRFGGDL
jgi:hypothetical protein